MMCFVGVFSIMHLFPWSGIVDDNQELSSTFRVPDLKRGRMVRLITKLSPKEEEMFRNMIRRMNTLVKVLYNRKNTGIDNGIPVFFPETKELKRKCKF